MSVATTPASTTVYWQKKRLVIDVVVQNPSPSAQPVTVVVANPSPPAITDGEIIEQRVDPAEAPSAVQRSLLGLLHVGMAAAAVAAMLIWTPYVEREVASGDVPLITRLTGLYLLALVGAVAGSASHTAAILGSRAGRHTLESSYSWWYVLRPVQAAMLAVVVQAAALSGFALVEGTDTSMPVAAAFLTGGLTGLFTDTILQKLRGLLGATSTEAPASKQAQPLAQRPKPLTS